MEEKVFRETRTQIGILKSRGLIIRNKRFAKEKLRQISYYNLINGYKDPFLLKNTITEKYIPGTRFEEIFALYEFDRKLRLLTLEYILEIEKQIKSLIAYSFSKAHGHKNYLSISNFDSNGKDKYSHVCSLISLLYNKLSFNVEKEPSVNHYVNGKNYVPLWVLVNCISAGDISKFYSNMLQKERDEVARMFKWGVREDMLRSCLFFLSSERNRCAHDQRLFSYISHSCIPQNNFFNYFRINSHKSNYFSLVVTLKILLSSQNFSLYFTELDNLLYELSLRLAPGAFKTVRLLMGFPPNWRKILYL